VRVAGGCGLFVADAVGRAVGHRAGADGAGQLHGKLRKNFFIGIKTPWTLASDAVWERAHRFGGWVFVAAGAAQARTDRRRTRRWNIPHDAAFSTGSESKGDRA